MLAITGCLGALNFRRGAADALDFALGVDAVAAVATALPAEGGEPNEETGGVGESIPGIQIILKIYIYVFFSFVF